jgi:hypothetical protein
MPTKLERFLQDLGEPVNASLHRGYEDSQLRDLITNLGAKTELFLKSTVLLQSNPKVDFDGCINALKSLGVSKQDREVLHSFRRVYNDSKHTPGYQPSLLELQDLLPEVVRVFEGFGARNLGSVNRTEALQHRRVLWIAVWDHYIGGDSEVHLVIPKLGWLPPCLDMVYIAMESWEHVKALLATVGIVKPGGTAIPEESYKQFASEDDFHDAIVYEGDYRAAMTVLAMHERRVDGLLPGLRREDHPASVIQAFAMASLDVGTDLVSDRDQAVKRISDRVIGTYAIPPDFKKVSTYAEAFGELLMKVPENERSAVNGPAWASHEVFNNAKADALATHPDLNVLIDRRGALLIMTK